jgi:hypothetical protein
MGKIIDVGDGMFIDTDPVDAPEGMPNAHIYAYAQMSSLERVSYGLLRTKGGPKDEEIESMKVGSYGMESLAPFWEFGHALDAIDSEHAFEETPFVEVENEEDYDEACEAIGCSDSQWEKPGLYDFRDDPPTYVGTVEKYEAEEMTEAADEAIDFMFQGDEWEDVYRELAAEG